MLVLLAFTSSNRSRIGLAHNVPELQTSRLAMMATNEADPVAQPMGLPGELRRQVALNFNGLDLFNLSATCRTLRTELLPQLFASLTLANSEKSARMVALVVSKHADLVKDFSYVITYDGWFDRWCRKCSSCEKAYGAVPDFWVKEFSQVYKILSTLYSRMNGLRSLRIKIVSKDDYTCTNCAQNGSVILITE